MRLLRRRKSLIDKLRAQGNRYFSVKVSYVCNLPELQHGDNKNLMYALDKLNDAIAENKALREELEHLRSRKRSGRKRHDELWMASYNDFAVKYESGMTIMEIVALGEISRRTAYRYKAYYDKMKRNE